MTGPIPVETLQRLQNEILESIARGSALEAVAIRVCGRAEELAPGALCSILTVEEGKHIQPLAGPSLPPDYSASLAGLPIGPCVGACGTAAWRGEPVEVRDIATDPLWNDYRDLALPAGLVACWSSPIKAGDGRVVGTFAFYYREPRGPSARERQIVETCVHLCAIAIEHEEARARVRTLAYGDALTGLPNRAGFRRHAVQSIAAGDPGESAAILCIDLDDFKSVNDAFGHPVGDDFLVAAAQRIAACVPERAFLARLGGDEFAILLTGANTAADADALATSILAAFEAPFALAEHRTAIGASIGIARALPGRIELVELARRAELALYAAKHAGRGVHRFFTDDMELAVQLRRNLKQDLRGALAAGAFGLAYQPIVSLATGEIVAAEALLRWRHPTRGPVPPAEFIPIAEEMGVIGTLGEWVFEEACAAAAAWPRPLRIAVNVSPLQLQQADLVRSVVASLERHRIAPERVDLEITETALLAETAATRMALRNLRAAGVSLALDDFGTGYSSLRLLRTCPVGTIKIDRSFVADIGHNPQSEAIIRAVIRLARDLGIKTAAEGIETEAQLRWLTEQGCSEGQGFHLGRPVDADAIGEKLREPAAVSRMPAHSGAGAG